MDGELRQILTPAEIARRIEELGGLITRRYAGEPLLMVGVLSGAFMFLADLARKVNLELYFDFVRLCSYGQGTARSGLELLADLRCDLRGRHVLIVEDIVDTGHSVKFLLDEFSSRQPASLAVCALVDKLERRETEVAVDFAGFRLEKGFVIGFGMDFAGKYRQLDGLYELTARG